MSDPGPEKGLAGSDAEHWHALYVRHQHEKSIALTLTKSGFDAFVPVYTAVRNWRDRTARVSLPLFPSYVFLHGGLNAKSKILSIPGVCSIVMSGKRAAAIPAPEIEAIRKAAHSSLQVEPHPFLREGDRIRIRSGQLAGVQGILLRRKSSLRLILSADLLERSIAVEVDARDVETIPQ